MQAQQTPLAVTILVPLLSGVTGALVTLIGNHFYSRWKDIREKREKIFRTLMSTRGFKTYPAHVEALCAVEVEWGGKKDGKVRSAWRAYNHHLSQQVPEDVHDPENVAWRAGLDELFADLIVALGDSIGTPQDKTEIKRGAYGPKSWWDAEYEAGLLRKGLISVLNSGKGLSIPVSVSNDQVAASVEQSKKTANSGE